MGRELTTCEDRGQGLNHGIADVASLVNGLTGMKDKAELAEVVSSYEAEMIPRGRAEVDSSVENAAMLHGWNKLMNSAMMTHGASKSA
jgi:2-polyprenyl-6-methoxyphenol hydroxylase-like FAD-dependent oxidoreductase